LGFPCAGTMWSAACLAARILGFPLNMATQNSRQEKTWSLNFSLIHLVLDIVSLLAWLPEKSSQFREAVRVEN
jgi:hypothetical protein